MKAFRSWIVVAVGMLVRIGAAEQSRGANLCQPPFKDTVIEAPFAEHALSTKDVSDAFGKNVARAFAVYGVELPQADHALLLNLGSMVADFQRCGATNEVTLEIPNLGELIGRFDQRPKPVQFMTRNVPAAIATVFGRDHKFRAMPGWHYSAPNDLGLFASSLRSQLYGLRGELAPSDRCRIFAGQKRRLIVFIPTRVFSEIGHTNRVEILKPIRLRVTAQRACPFCWGRME